MSTPSTTTTPKTRRPRKLQWKIEDQCRLYFLVPDKEQAALDQEELLNGEVDLNPDAHYSVELDVDPKGRLFVYMFYGIDSPHLFNVLNLVVFSFARADPSVFSPEYMAKMVEELIRYSKSQLSFSGVELDEMAFFSEETKTLAANGLSESLLADFAENPDMMKNEIRLYVPIDEGWNAFLLQCFFIMDMALYDDSRFASEKNRAVFFEETEEEIYQVIHRNFDRALDADGDLKLFSERHAKALMVMIDATAKLALDEKMERIRTVFEEVGLGDVAFFCRRAEQAMKDLTKTLSPQMDMSFLEDLKDWPHVFS